MLRYELTVKGVLREYLDKPVVCPSKLVANFINSVRVAVYQIPGQPDVVLNRLHECQPDCFRDQLIRRCLALLKDKGAPFYTSTPIELADLITKTVRISPEGILYCGRHLNDDCSTNLPISQACLREYLTGRWYSKGKRDSWVPE